MDDMGSEDMDSATDCQVKTYTPQDYLDFKFLLRV